MGGATELSLLTLVSSYTTNIIYKLHDSCYDDGEMKKSGTNQRSGKDKDMTAMNRFSYLYKESCPAAHLDEREMGVGFVYSSIDKHKRRNCVLEIRTQ